MRVAPAVVEKPEREKRRTNPKVIAAARELRDRYLEQVNTPAIETTAGKYDVTRAIAGSTQFVEPATAKLLAA